MHFTLVSVLLFSSTVWAQATYTKPCPLLGPDYPPSNNLSKSDVIVAASKNFTSLIQTGLTNTTTFGPLDGVNTSFSIDIYSLNDEKPLFTYHHSGSALINPSAGVSTVDSNTIYRVGSLSKLWTTYTFLINAGDLMFNEPVTNYIPELANYTKKYVSSDDAIDYFDWNHITVGDLASHLAGIPRDAAPDAATEQQIESFGLPPAVAPNVSFCGNEVQKVPCDRKAFFDDLLLRHPVVLSNRSPVYSNAAFIILSYILEKITNKSYVDLFNNTFIKDLRLNGTSYSQSKSDKLSIIPGNASSSWYNVNLFDETVAGGYFTTINDARIVGKSILGAKKLTPAMTRRWMRPLSFTSNSKFAIGAPWEITRAPGDRVSWIYAKSGDVGAYSSEVGFLPDYNVGFTVIAAGLNAHSNVATISDLIAATFVPAFEAASKNDANAIYAGTYTDKTSNSSIVIATTPTDPGLIITNWTLGGQEFLTPFDQFIGSAIGADPTLQNITIHLYPTGLTSKDGTTISFRAAFEAFPQVLNTGSFSENCQTWFRLDQIVYGLNSVDEFVFTLNSNKTKAISMSPRALNLTMDSNTGKMKRMWREF